MQAITIKNPELSEFSRDMKKNPLFHTLARLKFQYFRNTGLIRKLDSFFIDKEKKDIDLTQLGEALRFVPDDTELIENREIQYIELSKVLLKMEPNTVAELEIVILELCMEIVNKTAMHDLDFESRKEQWENFAAQLPNPDSKIIPRPITLTDLLDKEKEHDWQRSKLIQLQEKVNNLFDTADKLLIPHLAKSIITYRQKLKTASFYSTFFKLFSIIMIFFAISLLLLKSYVDDLSDEYLTCTQTPAQTTTGTTTEQTTGEALETTCIGGSYMEWFGPFIKLCIDVIGSGITILFWSWIKKLNEYKSAEQSWNPFSPWVPWICRKCYQRCRQRCIRHP